MYGVGDIVDSDVGAREVGHVTLLGDTPGDCFGSVTDTIGRFYQTPARLKVVCVQETTAILEITNRANVFGDLIVPFEPIPIPRS